MNKMCHESCGSSKEVTPRPDPDDPANPLGPSSMLKPLGLKLDFQGVQGTDFMWEGNDIEVVFREKVELLRFWIWKLQTSVAMIAMQQCDSRIRLSLEKG